MLLRSWATTAQALQSAVGTISVSTGVQCFSRTQPFTPALAKEIRKWVPLPLVEAHQRSLSSQLSICMARSFHLMVVTAIGGYGSQVSGSGIGFGAYLLTDGPYDSELEVSIVNSVVETHGGVAEVGGREGAAIGGSGNNEEVIKRIVIEKSNITATAGKHDKDVTVFGLRSDQGLGCLTITESKIVSTSAGHSVTMKSFDFNNELKCILDQHHL